MPALSYRPAIDWLKALGITLILVGHLAGAYINHLTPPIYPKQLGVAFFVFAMGYSLAMERRGRAEVVFNRLFEVFLVGIAIAVLVSLTTYVSRGTLALSNYMPFLLGSNVVVNNFPANPTTWYIGTYLHLLLLWSVLRNLRWSAPLLVCALVFEIASRYVLASQFGLFVAYMALPNWLTAFALGSWAGQRDWLPARRTVPVLGAAAIFQAMISLAVAPAITARTFPFMTIGVGSSASDLLLAATLVSVLYLGWTALVVLFVSRLDPPAVVRFLARNTLLVFIAHMPVYFWLDPVLESLGLSFAWRSAITLAVCLPGLALVSEALHRGVPMVRWRRSLARAAWVQPGSQPHLPR